MPSPAEFALPPLSAAPVSAATRLAYVLRHFRLAYDPMPDVGIGYAAAQAAVTVADGAHDFFEQAQPYPPAPAWREWAGQSVPFFFDTAPTAPLLDLSAGQAVVNADVISAAFYLLSGWQEYFSPARDRHGRFPYAASVQQRYGFVALPVVNYYFDVLKTAVEHVSGQALRPRPWREGAPFAAFISHDVDNLRSAWKAPAKAMLRQGKLLSFGKLLWHHAARPDAWDNLEAVAAATARYGIKSTFFVLAEHRKGAEGIPNADYVLSKTLRARLAALREQGCELASHGSIGTATDGRRLRTELRSLHRAPHGLRYHYLRWEPRQTPGVIDLEAVAYDSTLGFAEHFGFRNSCCLPFFPFDFARAQAHAFLEIPLTVMDATLHHPNYLQLRPADILPALQPMFAEIKKFGGVATVLWHNENFDPANETNGPRQFHELVAHLQQQGADFCTGHEIYERFTA